MANNKANREAVNIDTRTGAITFTRTELAEKIGAIAEGALMPGSPLTSEVQAWKFGRAFYVGRVYSDGTSQGWNQADNKADALSMVRFLAGVSK